MMKLYVDGSGWNGKESRACVTDENGKVLETITTNEKRTNNEMEYKALLTALMCHADNVNEIFTDSQLLVGHLTQNWRIKAKNLKLMIEQCKKMLELTKIKLTWIPRGKNKAGKVLDYA